jgi:hypothetical protein
MPKNRLRIRIGPDFDQGNLKTVSVNDDQRPIEIDSPHFTGNICMRVNGFKGIGSPLSNAPPDTTDPNLTEPIIPNAKYFEGKRRCFSLQIQGRFKQTWTADDVEFGIVLDRKIRLPAGADIALRIAQVSDSDG